MRQEKQVVYCVVGKKQRPPEGRRWKGKVKTDEAGLQAVRPSRMTRKDFGVQPLLATEATHFFIPSIGATAGGRVYRFANIADRDRMKAWFDELPRRSAAFYSHVFVHKNLLVQLNGNLPDARAAKYKAVLDTL